MINFSVLMRYKEIITALRSKQTAPGSSVKQRVLTCNVAVSVTNSDYEAEKVGNMTYIIKMSTCYRKR